MTTATETSPSPRARLSPRGARFARPGGATRSSCCRWRSSGSSSSTRSGTRSTSASTSGGSSGRSRRVGHAELPRPLRRPGLPQGDQEHPPVHGRRRPARDGARAADRSRDQPEDPRAGVLPLGVLLPARSRRPPRSPRSRSTSSTRTASSTRSSAATSAWFGDPSTALWSIIGLNAWTTAGTVMLFYLAALQSIPTDVYEAAAIDGTSTWRDVLEDHVPAAEAGALLRARRLRHRRAEGLRPGVHRLRRHGRARVLDVSPVVLYIYHKAFNGCELRGRGVGRRRAVRRHLPPDARPARDDRPDGGVVMNADRGRSRRDRRPAPARSSRGRRQGRRSTSCSSPWRSSSSRRSSGSISTSFKTLPGHRELQLHPAPVHDGRLGDGMDEVRLQALHR